MINHLISVVFIVKDQQLLFLCDAETVGNFRNLHKRHKGSDYVLQPERSGRKYKQERRLGKTEAAV